MKKKLVMLLLSLTVLGSGFQLAGIKSYALTQEEIIEMILEEHPEVVGKRNIDPAPGYEYGGSFDDLVQSVKDHNDQLVRDRAAERGLTIREYLEQTGQTCPATSSNRKLLDQKPQQTVQNDIKPQTESTVQKTETKKHGHSYTETITREATCREEGEKTFTCSCGKSYTEKLPVVPHEYLDTVTKEPTCKEEGEKNFTCKICGDSYAESLSKTDHVAGAYRTTTEPTCTEKGIREMFCKYCGEALKRQPAEALGHEAGEEVVEEKAGWFKEGKAVIRCSRCQEVLESRVIPADTRTGYLVVGGSVAVVLLLGIGMVLFRKRNK